MASEMLEKILDAENNAKKQKEKCDNEAESLISKAEKESAELIKKAKADAEAEAKKNISKAEEKASALIEEKKKQALGECEKMSELLTKKQQECNAVIIKKIIV